MILYIKEKKKQLFPFCVRQLFSDWLPLKNTRSEQQIGGTPYEEYPLSLTSYKKNKEKHNILPLSTQRLVPLSSIFRQKEQISLKTITKGQKNKNKKQKTRKKKKKKYIWFVCEHCLNRFFTRVRSLNFQTVWYWAFRVVWSRASGSPGLRVHMLTSLLKPCIQCCNTA